MLSTYPNWHEEGSDSSEAEIRPFPSRRVSHAVLALLLVASLFVFVSAFWQHIGSSAGVIMGESLSYGNVRGHVGAVAMVSPNLSGTIYPA